jgi:hypothetical protein
LPTISITSPSTVTICEGSNTDIVLALTGTAPWVWIGSDGTGQGTFNVTSSPYTTNVSPTVTTTYSIVSVTDANGCTNTSTDQVVVTVNTPAAVTITENAGVLTSSATTGNQWYEQTTGILTSQTGQTYTPTVSGNYFVIVTDVNGCTTISDTISFSMSVNQNLISNGIKIYPNPAQDQVWIEIMNATNSSVRVEILSMDGRLLFENETSKSGLTKTKVDLYNFASGVYFVKAISESKTTIQKLVIK